MIKKRFWLSVVVMMIGSFLFSGCGKAGQNVSPGTLSYPVKTTALLTVDDVSYRLDIDAESQSSYMLRINEPTVLEGMCLICQGGTVSVSYDGMVAVVRDSGYAAEHGILLVSRLFSLPSGSFSEAGFVKKDGIKYQYSTYEIEDGRVTYYRQEGISDVETIEGNINGHMLSLSFVNE